MTVEYGVRHPNGRVEVIHEKEANEGYMSGAEYAAVRARAVDGLVVTRTRTVTVTDWTMP